MKILLKISSTPDKILLMELMDRSLIAEIKTLIGRKKHSRAVDAVLKRGQFRKELLAKHISDIKVSLILTRDNAQWDLM